MKRPRMSIRLAMVVVALSAVPLGFYAKDLSARRATYVFEAEYHTRREREELHNVSVFDQGHRSGAPNINEPRIVLLEQAARLSLVHHAELKQKYQRALARPWESVEPDPVDVGEQLVRQSLYVH